MKARRSDDCRACPACRHRVNDCNVVVERQPVDTRVERRVPLNCDHEVAVGLLVQYLRKHSYSVNAENVTTVPCSLSRNDFAQAFMNVNIYSQKVCIKIRMICKS